ncbi:MAG: chemotaxis protein CheA [Roseibium sp.]|uniref:chemotaxis protein CheA n=1 Tax=Roseibium sp. TaxID=1936156 RepID=UPI001B29FB41|nr:chemotaxis protein CheA [Roseibium sp.]MBO6892651.1 chemotaxis protein CheA [Roseibium sp.]MBO6928219.1 chemotaxis protein CheA [Roseibium sp.]
MTGSSFNADDLAQFKQTFFDECAELLADLEERLSSLQEEAADSEALNAIFRAVHSIKAGAGAFGFSQLVQFAHRYEALLDRMRDGLVEQNERVADVLVRAGDILASFVEAAQSEQELGEDFGSEVGDEIDLLLAEIDGLESVLTSEEEQSDENSDSEGVQEDQNKSSCTYLIEFVPKAELLRHANEPLLLIRELQTLGDLQTECSLERLPTLGAMEPEDAYLSWMLTLKTDKSEEDIREVFEFVEDDCELKVSAIAAKDSGDGSLSFQIIEEVTEESEEDQATGTLKSEKPGAQSKAAETSVPETNPSDAPKKANVAAPKAKTASTPAQSSGVSSIRVDLDRVDRLVNVVGELVIAQSMQAQEAEDRQNGHEFLMNQANEDMSRIVRELQECVMAIRMQPVKSVFSRMPRLVREVSSKLNKQVRLLTEGEQTEVDKTVIEELADPLTHMIRNAIDHGIESPEEREAAGKKGTGAIKLLARHAGGNIIIQVIDNGSGINKEALLKKAISKGIVSEDAKLTDEEIEELIFAPGFSTAQAVTDVSGRGVGMDVVRRNINKLGGRISVQSVEGKGTCFTLTIPLSLAVLDGMLVAIGAEKYILPLASIVESFRPLEEQLRALAGGGEVVSMRGEYIRLIRAHHLFNVPGAVTDPCQGLVVVTETANGGKVGLLVDELIGQQQVVIKSIQENFDPVPGVSGATILGNGRVALILDIEQLKSMPVSADNWKSSSSEPLEQQEASPANGEEQRTIAPEAMTDTEGMQVPATV